MTVRYNAMLKQISLAIEYAPNFIYIGEVPDERIKEFVFFMDSYISSNGDNLSIVKSGFNEFVNKIQCTSTQVY